jgi:hypothetical protein
MNLLKDDGFFAAGVGVEVGVVIVVVMIVVGVM